MPRLLLPVCLALISATLLAADQPAADAPKPKAYPLDTCLVTGEKLDAMGGAAVLVKDGQEFKFCCKGCFKDFNKDPAKYQKKLADAEKTKSEKAAAEPAKP